jgi:DNA-nicking Smr family endonuclease
MTRSDDPPIRIPLEDSFDLHSFAPRDVIPALEDYLDSAREAGFREVRVIHGKGTGARRAEVRRWLAAREDVASFFDAPPDRGGTGATVIVLGPSRDSRPATRDSS